MADTSLSTTAVRKRMAAAAHWQWDEQRMCAVDDNGGDRLACPKPISWDDAIAAFESVGGHQFDYRRTKDSILVYTYPNVEFFAASEGCTGESLCRAILKSLDDQHKKWEQRSFVVERNLPRDKKLGKKAEIRQMLRECGYTEDEIKEQIRKGLKTVIQ